MFRAKRRAMGDSCEWSKEDYFNTLEEQFNSLPEDCDFYAMKHWFLCCSTAPDFQTFFDKEELIWYVNKYVFAGDALEIWAVEAEKMKYIYAKMPDEHGLIPIKGCAY